jgi:hypothetical protein
MAKKIFWLFNILFISAMLAQSEPGEFGKVMVQINDEPERSFYVESAVFYRNVTVNYDTTVYLKSGNTTNMLFSPQLSRGNSYVLHLILTSVEPPQPDQISTYDVYMNLGDTLWQQLEILNADSLTFIHPNGILTTDKLYSTHQTGQFNLVTNESGALISGTFQTEFDFPLPDRSEEYSHINMKGELNIPEGNLREGQETAIAAVKDTSKNRTRNILFAVLLSAFLVLFAVR